ALAASRAVDVGRVDEGDPPVKTHLNGPNRLGFVDLSPAEVTSTKLGRAADSPAAQTQRAYLQISPAQLSSLHVASTSHPHDPATPAGPDAVPSIWAGLWPLW